MSALASVWLTGQQPSRTQRTGRYVAASMAHPAKMLPAIAAQTIAAYTKPGELVVDPMCGIGTTLVEAVHLGRNAAGIEYEPRWARLAAANLAHAARQGATGTGQVVTGDARHLTTLLGELVGRVALVVTSPPYGASTHGHVRTTRDSGHCGVTKWNSRYSRDAANLAHRNLDELLNGFTEILDGCRQLLQPAGLVAVTARPIRIHGSLVDLPGKVITAAEHAGLILFDRIVCLLCRLRGGRVICRASFFQLHEARRNHARGRPIHALAHEDLLVLRAASTSQAGLAVPGRPPRAATPPNVHPAGGERRWGAVV